MYVAGDTEDIPEMQDLKDIDIAFLLVNQPYTMTVPQADRAALVIKPNVLSSLSLRGRRTDED